MLAVLVTIALRSQRENATWETLENKVLTEAVQTYQSGGSDDVRRYLDDLQDTQHVHAYLFNEKGREVSGARPPEFLGRMEREGTRPPTTLFALLTRGRFLHQSLNASDGHRYTLLMDFPAGPRVLFGPRGVPGLAMFIAVSFVGLRLLHPGPVFDWPGGPPARSDPKAGGGRSFRPRRNLVGRRQTA